MNPPSYYRINFDTTHELGHDVQLYIAVQNDGVIIFRS